jgi:hypothetical protein
MDKLAWISICGRTCGDAMARIPQVIPILILI